MTNVKLPYQTHLNFAWSGSEALLPLGRQPAAIIQILVEDWPVPGDGGVDQAPFPLLPAGQLTLHRELVILEESLHLLVLEKGTRCFQIFFTHRAGLFLHPKKLTVFNIYKNIALWKN